MINCKKKLDQILERILLLLESVIALISICVLAGMLVIFLLDIFQNPSFFQQKDAVHLFLQELLAIVIGLEFVKLLMHMTPANILEVLSIHRPPHCGGTRRSLGQSDEHSVHCRHVCSQALSDPSC